MGIMDDLIDFEVLEGHKENIQPLASGRSARKLAAVLTPAASGWSSHHTMDSTMDLNNAIREEYEKELADSEDHDDPLDIYNRYVKWTLNAYPSAQSTPKSQLLPLLERATKAFLSTPSYKNDPRYLKLWLLYIQFYCDSPKETFSFLSRHNIGDSLALFYEEFATWLEQASRWTQADEVYNLGLDRNARPVERLGRKYREFKTRFEARSVQEDEPKSPALPTVRPALAAKIDPFGTSAPGATPADPQASRGLGNGTGSISKGKKPKMAIFSDAAGALPSAMPSDNSKGWQSIGSIADRKKENAIEARPWAGEILKAGGKKSSSQKLAIFKDQSSSRASPSSSAVAVTDLRNKEILNARTGKREYIFADLHSIYPSSDENLEYSIEELRARRGGWLDKQWAKEDCGRRRSPLETGAPDDDLVAELQAAVLRERRSPILEQEPSREESDELPVRAPKQKKMKVLEVSHEPQTIKTNLDSPAKPRIRRRSKAEPTMTINTKAATDEVYDLFNRAPGKQAPVSADMTSSDRDYDTETDDYTSAGDSMSMGRSCDVSEAGDLPEDEGTSAETTGVSSWSEFSARRHVPGNGVDTPDMTQSADQTETQDASRDSPEDQPHDLITPVSEYPPETSRTKFVPVPPEDYEPPALISKDPAELAYNKLPFMTPIVEMTESSMGALTGKRSLAAKTPSRKLKSNVPMIDETQETLISPFKELLAEDPQHTRSENAEDLMTLELAPSDSPVKLPFDLPVLPPNFLPELSSRPESRDGPVIRELQCNPVDESIKNAILDSAKPSLANYQGFNQYPYASAGRAPEIRKYIKSLSSAKSAEKPSPPHLAFPDSRRSFTVKRELGKGAFAPVYLVESGEEQLVDEKAKRASIESCASVSSSPYARAALEALKMEDPPSAWEFYITRQALTRISAAPSPAVTHPALGASIIKLHELHLYEDEAYLAMTYHGQGTLLDLVNSVKAENIASGNTAAGAQGLDEMLVMFFTVELLRTVEALHSVGVLHGDLKADNCLVRFEQPASTSFSASVSEEAWGQQYDPTGAVGWSEKGLVLIDFGRGIDLQAFQPGVQFIADWKTGPQDCVEMREARPWSWQVDYHGLANIVHTMLFGKYIETVAISEADSFGSRRYKISASLRRYWQVEIWGGLFDMLLNPVRWAAEQSEGGKMPILGGLRGKREEIERWLGANCDRGVGLKGMIRRIEGRFSEKKR